MQVLTLVLVGRDYINPHAVFSVGPSHGGTLIQSNGGAEIIVDLSPAYVADLLEQGAKDAS